MRPASILKLSTLSSLLLLASCSYAAATSISVSKETTALEKVAPTLSPKVLKLALTAYNNARLQGLDSKQILTVINFHKADTKKRLYVFDIKNNKLLFNTLVAHGRDSGDVYATKFSNKPTTKESSVGLYETGKTFYGNDGYSLRLQGLDRGFNNNAYAREIVMHGAWYVSPNFVAEHDRLGRSWGCPAVSKKMAKPVINTLKNGTLIFAYAPDKAWLKHSKFLKV